MTKQLKPRRRSTPVRNAILVASLTSNAFLAALGYAVYTGQVRYVEPKVQTQEVALYGEDYVTTLAKR